MLPIRLSNLLIREQMSDTHVHPIRAEVDVAPEVLSDVDVMRNPSRKEMRSALMQQERELAWAPRSQKKFDDMFKNL